MAVDDGAIDENQRRLRHGSASWPTPTGTATSRVLEVDPESRPDPNGTLAEAIERHLRENRTIHPGERPTQPSTPFV